MGTVFYPAGRFSQRERIAAHASHIVSSLKWELRARWLFDPFHRISCEPGHVAFNASLARHDIEDLRHADVMVYFAPGGTRGGCHVEFGIALALGKRLVWVGERVETGHVFSYLPQVEVWPDVDSFIGSDPDGWPR